MKVLITTEFYLPFLCGVTTAVVNEKKSLEALGHEVRVLTIYDGKVSKFENDTYYFRSNFPQMYQDSYATLILSDPLLDDIYKWKPDIVHSQCEFFTMVLAKKISRKLHIPLVHTCHTDFEAYGVHFVKSEKIWHWATSTFIPKILKKVDYIVCPAKKNEDLLHSYGVTNPMSVIPCGLDLSHLCNDLSQEERMMMRQNYGFKKDDVVIVSVCRLSEEKNVKESIEHFYSLMKLRSNVKLFIVGDGSERENLEEQVKELKIEDSVKFAGNIPLDIIWKYFKVGDIFISSSKSEIQGLTYIEALACGLPIVCRKDQALDMSLIRGVNGFDFTSDEEFLNVILPLIDDESLRSEMGKAALHSVEKFSLERFADSLLNIFNMEIARYSGKVD